MASVKETVADYMQGKWVFVGHLVTGQTSLMRMRALQRCGIDVHGYDTRRLWRAQGWLRQQLVVRTESGSYVDAINEQIVALAREVRPKYVWFDKQEYVRPQTLEDLRAIGASSIYYTPDPYFTLSWKRTRLMDACLPLFDLLITSKTYELGRFSQVGPKCLYLPLGYCDEVHRPMPDGRARDVAIGFVGGWEPRRQIALESLRSRGLSVEIRGYAWDHLIDGRWTLRRRMRLARLAGKEKWQLRRSPLLHDCIISGEVYGDEFAVALSSTAIGLGFLRTVCPDQHTTRSFEIPACGSMLLADRTQEHQELFEEGKEADYFSSVDEMVDKAAFYCRNPGLVRSISENGRQRCVKSGYSYVDRFKTVLESLGVG